MCIIVVGVMLVIILLTLLFSAATQSASITPSTGRQIRTLVRDAQTLKETAPTAANATEEAFQRGKATGFLHAALKIAGSAPAAAKVSGISIKALVSQLASPSPTSLTQSSEDNW